MEAIRPFYYHSFLPLDSILKDLTVQTSRSVFFKFGQKILGEDEAEETGDGVWRGNILCGCVLTLSDVGSSPA